MDNKILTRDSFVNEVYSKRCENELNEGIFDFFKTLMKQEWSNVKSKDATIKQKLEQADKNLKGFTVLKMKKAGACAEIRQQLCDFANTLWEAKLKEFEDGKKLQKMLMGLKDKDKITSEDEETVSNSGKVSKYMKQFNIKDKSLADKLTNYETRINQACKGDPDLTRWANILKADIRNIVNDMIIEKYDKEEAETDKEKEAVKKAKEIEKAQIEAQKKEAEQKNKEQEKKQEEALKKIEKERTDVLASVGVKPLKNQTGDKAVSTLMGAFNNIKDQLQKLADDKKDENNDKNDDSSKSTVADSLKYSFKNVINESEENENKGMSEDVKKILQSDLYFGLKQLSENENISDDGVNIIIAEMSVVFDACEKLSTGELKNAIKQVPSDAIQAMFVGLAQTIVFALTNEDINSHKEILDLLARCAIASDKTLGYGLPAMEEGNDKSGNVFTTIMQTLKDANDKAGVFKDKDELLKKFKENITNIFDDITKKAEELKEARQKEDEKESNEVEKEDNK